MKNKFSVISRKTIILSLIILSIFGGIAATVGIIESPIFGTSATFNYSTASTVPYFDADKKLISSAVTPTQLGYLSGVTSAIQTQLDGKASTLGADDNYVTDAEKTNIGNLGSAAYTLSTAYAVALGADDNYVTDAEKTNIGNLASAAYLSAGTSANNAVQLDGTGKLPAVDGSQLTGIASVSTVNTQTASTYTLVLGDANNIITMNNASANTLNIPLNSSVAFPVGTIIAIDQIGAGATTIDGATGVTVNGTNGGTETITGQYLGASIKQIAINNWIVQGGI